MSHTQSTAHISHVESCLRHVAIAVGGFTSSPSGTRVTFIKAFRYKKALPTWAKLVVLRSALWLRAPLHRFSCSFVHCTTYKYKSQLTIVACNL